MEGLNKATIAKLRVENRIRELRLMTGMVDEFV
jgi:hypothetical protein